MLFEMARFNVPNLAAIAALALAPLIALPMHLHSTGAAKAEMARAHQIEVQVAEKEAPANVAYAIFD